MELVEEMAELWYANVVLESGVYVGNPYRYCDGVTTSLLRSGKDGPHVKLADDMCGLRRDTV